MIIVLPISFSNFVSRKRVYKFSRFLFTNLEVNVYRFSTILSTLAFVLTIQQFIGRNTTVCDAFALRFYHPNDYVRHTVLRLKIIKMESSRDISLIDEDIHDYLSGANTSLMRHFFNSHISL